MGRGLFVGRFQPFHLGHLKALRWILEREDEVIICIGSAQYSHSLRNPFTVGERVEMIWRVLRYENLLDRCMICTVPDTNNVHSVWVSQVLAWCPKFNRVYTNDPLTSLLFLEKGIPVEKIPFFNREKYEGTKIRRKIALDEDWREYLHPEVVKVIEDIGGVRRLKELYNL
ncbi:MAG: nicotinamide-nucleotide adenylyltransferase [Thermoprotei archaeon]|nr:MAG: nicotinamide-nucleotide adenylyltransferase [Thermoprotei archaeon]